MILGDPPGDLDASCYPRNVCGRKIGRIIEHINFSYLKDTPLRVAYISGTVIMPYQFYSHLKKTVLGFADHLFFRRLQYSLFSKTTISIELLAPNFSLMSGKW